MKVALVYDRVNKWGGAERTLLALHEIYPEAPLYTAVYNSKRAPWAKVFSKVIPSFLQSFPFARTHHEAYPYLMPLAFESFNFDEYDVVISVTSESAKGIITKPKALHICYCLTPTRYLWSGYFDYKDAFHFGILNPIVRLFFPIVAARLRFWDQIAAQRPDHYLAISNNVAQRITKYYGREAEVIYPPVDMKKFCVNTPEVSLRRRRDPSTSGVIFDTKKDYFLTVSRFVPYKRIDIAIEAFNKLGWPLKIIGDGMEVTYLRKMAKQNIEFLGQDLTDEELIGYYQKCRALIFAGEEDLGLVSLEAQACGKPVVALRGGGIPETIIEGATGEFFYPQTPGALIKVIKEFKAEKYRPEDCRKNTERFDKKIFKEKFKKFVEDHLK